MRIHRVDIDWVAIPFVKPFPAGTTPLAKRQSLLVRLYEDTWVGLGEVSPPVESLATQGSKPLQDLWDQLTGPALAWLFGRDDIELHSGIQALKELNLDAPLRFGLETALWDLEGQRSQQPVFRLLGGKRKSIESGLTVPLCSDAESMLEEISQFLLSDGYRRVKVQIQPGWDQRPLEAIRRRFPANLKLAADAGGRYEPSHLSELLALDSYDLLFLEDPFPGGAIQACCALAREMKTPLCLGHSLNGAQEIRRAVSARACRVVNLTLPCIGSLEEARQLVTWLEHEGAHAWVGSVQELGVASTAGLHLSSLPTLAHPTDIASSFRWFKDEVVRPWLAIRSGELSLSSKPGLGLDLSAKGLGLYSLRSATFTRSTYGTPPC